MTGLEEASGGRPRILETVRSTWAIVVVVVVLGAGCTCERQGPPPEAVATCRQAFAAVGASDDPAATVTGIFAGCADLHLAPGCREAWHTAATVSPEMRIVVAAAGCRRAYCPELPAPRPALCERDVSKMPPSELGPAWAELERVVLAREMGDAGDLFGQALSHLARPIVVPVPPPEDAPDAGLVVTLAVKREGPALVVLRLDDPTRRAVLPEGGGDGAVAPLVTGADRVVLAADAGLPYQDVLRVMDAVRAAGVTRFAIAADSAPAP